VKDIQLYIPVENFKEKIAKFWNDLPQNGKILE